MAKKINQRRFKIPETGILIRDEDRAVMQSNKGDLEMLIFEPLDLLGKIGWKKYKGYGVLLTAEPTGVDSQVKYAGGSGYEDAYSRYESVHASKKEAAEKQKTLPARLSIEIYGLKTKLKITKSKEEAEKRLQQRK